MSAARLVAVLLVHAAWFTLGASGAGAGSVWYQPPVSAAISDFYRPPATAYGPGNRGLTYATRVGQTVVASATGTVAFAGQVGGRGVVSIDHVDGRRSTYTRLRTVAVKRGQSVPGGAAIGTSELDFHFGIRVGLRYEDPLALFADAPREPFRVWLVPVEARAVASSGGSRLADLLDEVVDVATGKPVVGDLLEVNATIKDLLDPQDCSHLAPPASATERRAAILVGGLGSTSASAAIDDVDTTRLGYGPGDTARFSYRGGQTPRDDPSSFDLVETTAYDKADTQTDLRSQGRALADLIESAAEALPGVPVDVIAHSQGGLVVRLALLELEIRGLLHRVGVVVTIATPHMGADLIASTDNAGPLTIETLAPVSEAIGLGIDPGSTSVRQMSPTSDLIDDLEDAGVPDSVDFRSIGARGDLVVPGTRTVVDGEPGVIIDIAGPSAHDRAPGAEATQVELARAIAGMAPGCESRTNRVVDRFVGSRVSVLEGLIDGQPWERPSAATPTPGHLTTLFAAPKRTAARL